MITDKDFERGAFLSRLEFSQDQKEGIIKQLNTILEYLDGIHGLDTEGVKPLYNMVPDADAMREDIVRPSMDTDKVLMNGPEIQDGFFIVPKIIE